MIKYEEQILLLFGKNIRNFRRKLGLSQEKFSLKIGMDRSYYSAVENGKRNISLKNVAKIAEGLDVDVVELFKED